MDAFLGIDVQTRRDLSYYCCGDDEEVVTSEQETLTVTSDLTTVSRGPKDMLDASVAAVTVREFVRGRGCAVGGGDFLGEIILPRPLNPKISEVCDWPG